MPEEAGTTTGARAVRIGILGGGGIPGAHAPAFMKLKDRCTVAALQNQHQKRRSAGPYPRIR